MGDDTRSKIPLPTKNEVDGERWQVIGGDGVDRGGRAAPTVFAEAGVVRAGPLAGADDAAAAVLQTTTTS